MLVRVMVGKRDGVIRQVEVRDGATVGDVLNAYAEAYHEYCPAEDYIYCSGGRELTLDALSPAFLTVIPKNLNNG